MRVWERSECGWMRVEMGVCVGESCMHVRMVCECVHVCGVSMTEVYVRIHEK